jgi:dTDP-4-amino-4,6-dideoxygalactose transaminase
MTQKTSKPSSDWIVPFNNLYAGLEPDQQRLENTFKEVLQGGRFIMGQRLFDFEAKFAKYNDMKFGVGVASGTDAISMALGAAGIGNGDLVLTVANSAPATVTAIKASGCRVRFCDIDDRALMDPGELKQKRVMEGVKAVVPVHLYGRIANVKAIADIADAYGAVVIEDAAQAAGASSEDYKIGTRSKAVAFSFYPTKNLGALGDGGMVLTNDEAIMGRIKLARNYGLVDGKNLFYGCNSRLDELQAALLDVRLDSLIWINNERRKIAVHYCKRLSGMKHLAASGVYRGDNCHLYIVHCDERDNLQKFLEKEKIQTMIHYQTPAHKMPIESGNFYPIPVKRTEEHCRTVLSLPCWPGMKEGQVETVVRAIRRYFHE